MNPLTFLINYIKEETAGWNTYQWALLAGGLLVAGYALARALRASRIGSYKVWMLVFKAGFSLIVLAFAWPYAQDLYNTAVSLTGSPLYGVLSIILGVFFGYNVVMKMLKGKSRG